MTWIALSISTSLGSQKAYRICIKLITAIVLHTDKTLLPWLPGLWLSLVFAMGANSRFSSGSGSYPEPDRGNVLYHTKNLDRCNSASLQPKTPYFNLTTWAAITYLSSDGIVTCSRRRLSSFTCSFTSCIQICDPTIIRWVAIKNPLISRKIRCYFIVIHRIFVQLQIWMREVKEQVQLDNLRLEYITTQSELRYLIGVKVAGTAKWNRSSGTTRPNNRGFMSSPGNTPTKPMWFGFLARSQTEPNRTPAQKLDHWLVTRTHC